MANHLGLEGDAIEKVVDYVKRWIPDERVNEFRAWLAADINDLGLDRRPAMDHLPRCLRPAPAHREASGMDRATFNKMTSIARKHIRDDFTYGRLYGSLFAAFSPSIAADAKPSTFEDRFPGAARIKVSR
jgi:hypothetical protein